MSTNNKKRPLSEISDDSTPSNKKRKVMIDDDDNKEMKGLDAAEPEEQSKLKNELMYSGEPITLNVGGLKYETSLHTLTKYRDSVLSKMFEGKFSLIPSKDGSYFIDRDGTYFGMILNYLRTGKITMPQTDRQYVISHLLMESQYYQIASLNKELKFMSIGSSMLSPQQIVDIQTMISPNEEKRNFKWKLLYKYNIIENIRPRDEASMFGDMISVIEGRKSVLILMMTQATCWGIFLPIQITSGASYICFNSISDGFAFNLNNIAQKIELASGGWGNWGLVINPTSGIKVPPIQKLLPNPIHSSYYIKPNALEIFQI
eukprot:888660_1